MPVARIEQAIRLVPHSQLAEEISAFVIRRRAPTQPKKASSDDGYGGLFGERTYGVPTG